MRFTLCEDTGMLAVEGACPAHGGDACLLQYMPCIPEPEEVAKLPTVPGCRVFPAVEERVESGPVQFGDDWPGLFLRGKHCANYAMNLDVVLRDVAHPGEAPQSGIFALHAMRELMRDLRSAILQRKAKP